MNLVWVWSPVSGERAEGRKTELHKELSWYPWGRGLLAPLPAAWWGCKSRELLSLQPLAVAIWALPLGQELVALLASAHVALARACCSAGQCHCAGNKCHMEEEITAGSAQIPENCPLCKLTQRSWLTLLQGRPAGWKYFFLDSSRRRMGGLGSKKAKIFASAKGWFECTLFFPDLQLFPACWETLSEGPFWSSTAQKKHSSLREHRILI